MRFKKSPQLPVARRTRVWHHHGSHMSTYPGAILLKPYTPQGERLRMLWGNPVIFTDCGETP
jgi:hypothetical protein